MSSGAPIPTSRHRPPWILPEPRLRLPGRTEFPPRLPGRRQEPRTRGRRPRQSARVGAKGTRGSGGDTRPGRGARGFRCQDFAVRFGERTHGASPEVEGDQGLIGPGWGQREQKGCRVRGAGGGATANEPAFTLRLVRPGTGKGHSFRCEICPQQRNNRCCRKRTWFTVTPTPGGTGRTSPSPEAERGGGGEGGGGGRSPGSLTQDQGDGKTPSRRGGGDVDEQAVIGATRRWISS